MWDFPVRAGVQDDGRKVVCLLSRLVVSAGDVFVGLNPPVFMTIRSGNYKGFCWVCWLVVRRAMVAIAGEGEGRAVARPK